MQNFDLFPVLPIEIRLQIWPLALVPRIIRWIRTDDLGEKSSNTFTSSTPSPPLFATSREAREACILYGEYILLSTTPRTVWYSPKTDYLFLDARWIHLAHQGLPPGVVKDPMDSLPFALNAVRNLMIHPNYTEGRMKPGIPIERMKFVEKILITADEKSIGSHTDLMQASVYDLRKFYEFGQKNRGSQGAAKIPYIAVGCLGWVGEEKSKIRHGDEDHRELIAVFAGYAEIKMHLNVMREEEMRFLKERFGGEKKTGFVLHFKEGKTMESVGESSSTARRDTADQGACVAGDNCIAPEGSMLEKESELQGKLASGNNCVTPGSSPSENESSLRKSVERRSPDSHEFSPRQESSTSGEDYSSDEDDEDDEDNPQYQNTPQSTSVPNQNQAQPEHSDGLPTYFEAINSSLNQSL
jgi:hypothetical protein